jgi:Lytic transglycolase
VGVRGVVSAGVGLCTRIRLHATNVVAEACARRPKTIITLAIAGVAIATGAVLMPISVDSNPAPTASFGMSEAPPWRALRQHSRVVGRLDWNRYPSLDFASMYPDAPVVAARPAGSGTGTVREAAITDEAELSQLRAKASGLASFYRRGVKTANGEAFDPTALTAAHRTLPFGTKLRVTHLETGKSVIVRVNDRGPFIAGRVVDLTYSAAESLGMIEQGVAKVHVAVVQ